MNRPAGFSSTATANTAWARMSVRHALAAWPSAVTYFSFIKSKRASSGIIMPIAILTPAKENSHVTNFARGNDDTLDLRRDSRCHKGGLGGVGDGSKLPEIST
jgi:hypothetical protein